ncbi:MAG: hypothetical protein SGILL_009869, partial [Bacillariaceae sp.]
QRKSAAEKSESTVTVEQLVPTFEQLVPTCTVEQLMPTDEPKLLDKLARLGMDFAELKGACIAEMRVMNRQLQEATQKCKKWKSSYYRLKEELKEYKAKYQKAKALYFEEKETFEEAIDDLEEEKDALSTKLDKYMVAYEEGRTTYQTQRDEIEEMERKSNGEKAVLRTEVETLQTRLDTESKERKRLQELVDQLQATNASAVPNNTMIQDATQNGAIPSSPQHTAIFPLPNPPLQESAATPQLAHQRPSPVDVAQSGILIESEAPIHQIESAPLESRQVDEIGRMDVDQDEDDDNDFDFGGMGDGNGDDDNVDFLPIQTQPDKDDKGKIKLQAICHHAGCIKCMSYTTCTQEQFDQALEMDIVDEKGRVKWESKESWTAFTKFVKRTLNKTVATYWVTKIREHLIETHEGTPYPQSMVKTRLGSGLKTYYDQLAKEHNAANTGDIAVPNNASYDTFKCRLQQDSKGNEAMAATYREMAKTVYSDKAFNTKTRPLIFQYWEQVRNR